MSKKKHIFVLSDRISFLAKKERRAAAHLLDNPIRWLFHLRECDIHQERAKVYTDVLYMISEVVAEE